MKLVVTSAIAIFLAAAPAFAAGTAPAAPAAAPAAAAPAMKTVKPRMNTLCKVGMVPKTMKGKTKCVKAKAEAPTDQDIYAKGYALAKSGEYEEAIKVLSTAQNQNDPDVLNMLGYSNRKAGRIELGISYYSKALAMKPDFARAREYLGEGYAAAGKLDLAKLQLAEIRKICGTTCSEYQDLSKVIDAAAL